MIEEKNKQKIPFMVWVRCMTYNHAQYIEDAMNGFTMQQTNFPFVCTIIDDASTDGEPEVIRKYLQEHFDLEDKAIVRNEETDDYIMTFARHRTNINCYFAVYYLRYNHYSIKKTKMTYMKEWCENSKYLALCEGDDYWIEPHKLKMQVSVLEKNPSVTFVYSSFRTVNEKGEKIYRPEFEKFKNESISGEILHLLLNHNFIMTLTVCMRMALDKTELLLNSPARMDLAIFINAAMYGDVYFFHQELGSYRKIANSMVNSHPEIVSQKSRIIRRYFSEKYIERPLKVVSLSQHTKILYTISHETINDRNWRILNIALKNPYFLLIFINTVIVRLMRKCIEGIVKRIRNI